MTTDEGRVTRIFERAAELGITREWLAFKTGKSWSAVYAYSIMRRNPPTAWCDEAESLLDAHDDTSRVLPKVVA